MLLGFDATLATAMMFRFGRDKPRPYAAMGRDVHCATLVTLNNNEYLIDLVWGNAFRYPLQIGGETTNIPGEDIRRCIKKDDTYQLQVKLMMNGKLSINSKMKIKKLNILKKTFVFFAVKNITYHMNYC